jgi:hypothetical protein
MGTEVKTPLFFCKYFFIIFREQDFSSPKNPFRVNIIMRIQDIDESLANTLIKGASHVNPQAIMRQRQLTNNLDMVINRARASSPQDMARELSQLHAELNAVVHQFPELASKLQPAIQHIRAAMGQPATATTVLQQVRQLLSQF